MARIFLFMMVSLDGYFEGPDHDLSWHYVDEEFNEYAIKQTDSVGTLLFGRRTYDLMASYWPTEEALKDDPVVAHQMNTTPKIVFSKSLQNVLETEHWKGVSLRHDINVEEIKHLKKSSRKDIGVYGSNNLAVQLLEKGLLDEIRIMINPVLIGKGTSLFVGLKEKKEFTLTQTKQFKNGNVLLSYTVTNN